MSVEKKIVGKDTFRNLHEKAKAKILDWATISTGPSVTIGLKYGEPAIIVDMKIINIGLKGVLKSGSRIVDAYLYGHAIIHGEKAPLTVELDKLEIIPDRTATPCHLDFNERYSSLCHMKLEESDCAEHTSLDFYTKSITLLQKCVASSKLDIGNIFPSRIECAFQQHVDDRVSCNLKCQAITVATEFQATPIKCFPIIGTALAKSLADPIGQNSIHKEPKSGYLTMNDSRSLLLLLENDPKVQSFLLVGIWISGVNSVQDSFTWRAALRYLYCDMLQKRACHPPEIFLVVFYPKMETMPQAYEFNVAEHSPILQFRQYGAKQYFTFRSGQAKGKITLELQEMGPAARQNLDMMEGCKTKEQFHTPSLKNSIAKEISDDTNGHVKGPNFHKQYLRRASDSSDKYDKLPKTPSTSVINNDVYRALAIQDKELRFLRSQVDRLLKEREQNGIQRLDTPNCDKNIESHEPGCGINYNQRCKSRSKPAGNCCCGSVPNQVFGIKTTVGTKATSNSSSNLPSNIESNITSLMTLDGVKMSSADHSSPETSICIDLPDLSASAFSSFFPADSSVPMYSETPISGNERRGSDGDEISQDSSLYNNLLERINSMLTKHQWPEQFRSGNASPENMWQLNDTRIPSSNAEHTAKLPCESIFLPKLHYRSFEGSSETIDETTNFDSLEVKYLKTSEIAPVVRDMPHSSVTVYGLGTNNLTLATRQYLEKYGLM